MALTDEGTGFNVSMPVAPAYGGGYKILLENVKIVVDKCAKVW